MIRLFQTHKIRRQTELCGLWQFTKTDGIEEMPKEYAHTMPVPGCWEAHPSFLTFRGTASYRREICIEEDTSIRFEFKGVSHTAHVYFDGKFIARHYNAYTPFSVVVKDVKKGEHSLVVNVDNSFSEESALHIGNDYYTYGGLIRPVAMEEIHGAYIKRLEFIPFRGNGVWNAEISVFIKSCGSQKALNVSGSMGNVGLNFGRVEFDGTDTIMVKKTFEFNDVEEWSAQNPSLYCLEVMLYENGSAIDDMAERVGFREVEAAGGKILLNGEEIFIKGFNRHEDHGNVGCALPFQLMAQDVELIHDMHANGIRTCHYPNDELFLDMCDEKGIFVWEENHARGFSIEQMEHPNFDIQCENCIDEMVKNHINHPSIIMWGILNECASDHPAGRQKYEKQFAQIKSMDKSRPLTFASNKEFRDICFDLVDIISMNIYSKWYKWYNGKSVEEIYEGIREWVKSLGVGDKPVIISEFGAGAIYGFRDPAKLRWTEELQSDILDESLSVYMQRPEIGGVFIWQFADCRVTEENDWALNRPASRNNKGVLDMYRRPKLAYETVKKHFS